MSRIDKPAFLNEINSLFDTKFFNKKVNETIITNKEDSNIIVANRMDDELTPYRDRVYTKDLFGKD